MILKKGSNLKEEVKHLQGMLTRLGYLTAIDGEFGKQTETNLKAFQADNSLLVDGIFGPISKRIMESMVSRLPRNRDELPVSSSETPWMDWLVRNKGQKEIPGDKSNPFIIDTFRYTSLRNHPMATTDSTAWCAALACAALEKNGYKSPNSAAAKAFDTYGTESELKYGAIVTFKRSGGSGRHVTFFVKESQGKLVCLGGNQANALIESSYDKERLVACRWPIKRK